ncbi:Ni/Fe hydrogenase subunit alpha [Desulfohalobium retbaense]|uniref:Nickel-dependent hydrogenase large subunit n=1 Tax=Desulfohalobium retbaense (strain ATCC 49708 / DSM 5692 / JCM 16813 / HR100) TaxID=485915 RepID=C8X545_DESRD|nr:Ni/Fe hydrogenase subunit alpha [Desulfohalobium retbaense]ACV69542.1 nickel-dependent hydrogenase large subunit [Desulfohalobium retbaense DSM 5692]
MAKKISIDPLTRLEGHGKIDIFLNDDGTVQDSYFQVVELRGFEQFCQGRPVEELPRITPKICGVCPGAHHMASSKAADAVYGLTPPPAARKIRELFYNAHIAHSHILHFFALAAPDFMPGPEAGPGKRNILGLVDELGKGAVRRVLQNRGYAQKIQGLIAGHPIHPVASLPGGMAGPVSEKTRQEIAGMASEIREFAQFALWFFENHILAQDRNRELLTGELFTHRTHYMGLVDSQGRVNFYDGQLRVVTPEGETMAQFDGSDYLEHLAETVLPWSYMKFPYLRDKGWHGLIDGADSGVYRVNSLARLNVADGMATPLAQEAYETMRAFYGGTPIHNTLAFHWARLVELMQAAEALVDLSQDPEVTDTNVRSLPEGRPGEGVGVVEAPRGSLIHHYTTDANGLVKTVNLIVATVQNNAGMGMSVKKAAQGLIQDGAPDEAVLDMIEMGYRAYDPCLACATHALPGESDLEVRLWHNNAVFRTLKRS